MISPAANLVSGSRLRFTRSSSTSPALAVVFAAAIVASPILRPTFAFGLALADAPIAVLIVVALSRSLRDPRAFAVLRPFGIPFLLIAIGSTTATLGGGLSAQQILKDVGALLLLPAGIIVLVEFRIPALVLIRRAVMVSAILGAATVIALDSGASRARGFFPNPNVAAHFLAVTLLVLLLTFRPGKARAVLCFSLALAILYAGSFGAVLMLASAGLYYLSTNAGVVLLGIRVSRVVLIAAATLTVVVAVGAYREPLEDVGFSAARFDKSSGGRTSSAYQAFALALRHPLGVGVGQVDDADLLENGLEIHNDFLGFMVERGVIGAAGLVWLASVLWRRFATQASATRMVLSALFVASTFRSTLNYRHIGLLLAVVIVSERSALVTRQQRSGKRSP